MARTRVTLKPAPERPELDRLLSRTQREHQGRRLEAVAKAIFCEMNSIMHDHEDEWSKCNKQVIYRDCARAALVAAAHFPTV